MKRTMIKAMMLAAMMAGAGPVIAQTPPRPEVSQPDIAVPTHAGIAIPMRDMAGLMADIYLPEGTGRFPVILTATPYSRNAGTAYARDARYWTDHGYAFVVVDVRGLNGSQGEYDWFRTDVNDNHDIVEWLAVQPWSDGKVGMRGQSYSGTNQWLAAKTRPPHLRCLVPNAVVGRYMEELPRNGGAFKLRWAIEWLRLLETPGKAPPLVDEAALLAHRPLRTMDVLVTGQVNPLFRRFVDHDTLDEYWQYIQLTDADFSAIDIPTLAFTGWYDGTLPGTLFHYTNMKRLSSAADRQFLVVGPWEHNSLTEGGYHGGQPVRRVGDVDVPDNGFVNAREITRSFYDWCLKDGPVFRQASTRVFITGSDVWLDLPDYPSSLASARSLYLHSTGTASIAGGIGGLSAAMPLTEKPDHYVYDPANPVPEYIMRDGQKIRLQSTPVDIRQVQDRPDVLVYETEPLKAPLTILGNVALELFASSDATDTDFTSHIADVLPDGRAIKLGPQSGGIIRARYRNGYAKEELLVPGKVEKFRIDYFDIGHTFKPGHRLRISISSSNFPWISANPNTGHPIGSDTAAPRRARQSVYHDRRFSSRLVFTEIPTPASAAR